MNFISGFTDRPPKYCYFLLISLNLLIFCKLCKLVNYLHIPQTDGHLCQFFLMIHAFITQLNCNLIIYQINICIHNIESEHLQWPTTLQNCSALYSLPIKLLFYHDNYELLALFIFFHLILYATNNFVSYSFFRNH
jgi:hypothetical protein